MRKTRKCAFCGKEFTCNSGSQRYCSEQCAEAAKAQRKKKQQDFLKAVQPVIDIASQEYLTFSKAAILMGCSRQYVYKLVNEGKLPASRISSRMAFVRKADIEMMLAGNPYHRVLPTYKPMKNIYGPYEKKVVLEKGSTNVNGPHQGALVDTPEGEWWFYHFQLTEPLGRVVHLQPAHWKDGWPVIGVDIDMNGIGEPVKVWTKPNTGKKVPVSFPQGGDSFDSPELNLQWQFNHNPSDADWNLTERKGWLLLKALKADHLRASRNMLTQKCIGYEGTVTTEMDMSSWTEGQRAGLFCIGNLFNGIGILKENGKNYLYLENNGSVEKVKPVSGKKIYFRATMNARTNQHQLYYSTDNKNFTPCGEAYSLRFGDWKGARVGLYSYNTLRDGGNAFFNWFTYDFN